ncbi:MAG TPA: Bro-N domain-containing protein [Candidatus Accumulibacter phosphatis]|nr:Bro-N domain-containing protein [Candidatus Accumulibacter phosphatis]
MAEQLITADFFGNPVSIIDHAGKRWLTAEEVGRCLGYNEANTRIGIVNLYNRHADEFTETDTCVIKLMAQGQHREIRIFSAEGCITLGWLSSTARAKDFRDWAKHVLAAHLTNAQRISVSPDEWLDVTHPGHNKEAEHERVRKVMAIEDRQRTAAAMAAALEPDPLPAVMRSPRLEASMARMASSVETMAAGMQTMSMQLNVTAKYIGLLELNQAGTRKVTAAVAREALALKAEGMNNADIGRLLRISRTAVSLLVRDKYPVNIPEHETPKTTAGELLEGWIEREQARLAETLTKGGA